MSVPFYKNELYINSVYALDIAIENYFAENYLNGEYARTVYATNGYALRKRAEKSKTNTLDFPFMNFHLSNVEYTSAHNLYHMGLACNGAEFAEYGGYIKPIISTFSYEMTFYFERWDDTIQALSTLIWDAAIITRINPVVQVNVPESDPFNLGYTAIVDFTPQLDPEYHENEWLEKNKIHTVSCDLSIQSFLFVESEFGICIPDEILFNFSSNHGTETTDHDTAMTLMIDHFNGTVS